MLGGRVLALPALSLGDWALLGPALLPATYPGCPRPAHCGGGSQRAWLAWSLCHSGKPSWTRWPIWTWDEQSQES